LYRQQAARHVPESEEPQPDFFEVMSSKVDYQVLLKFIRKQSFPLCI
jgi:hypothetical protein